jgi:isopenicillin-N N-acyltransferase like protein
MRVTPVIVMSGTAAERGESYGEQARDQIREAVQRWHAWIAPGLRIPVDEYLQEFVSGTGFIAATRQLNPSLLEETAGISRGSGVPHDEILGLNLMDEDWWFRPRFAKETLEHCSSFGVRPGPRQSTMIGQNMDLPTWLDGLQVLLDIRPLDDTPALLAPAFAGMVGLNAINEHGIGVCVNSLDQLPKSTDGVPIAFIIRTLATATSFREVIQTLTTLPHATGQNFLVAGPQDVADYECSAAGASPCQFEDRIVHTNHPLVDSSGTSIKSDIAAHASTNSELRLASLSEGLEALDVVDVSEAERLLELPPVCRINDPKEEFFTFHSVIIEPLTRTLHLTMGPPDQSEFATHRVAFAGGATDS